MESFVRKKTQQIFKINARQCISNTICMNYYHSKKFGLLKLYSGYWKFYLNSPKGFSRKIINAQTDYTEFNISSIFWDKMIKHLDINNDTYCKSLRIYFTVIVIFHDKKTINFCSVCIACWKCILLFSFNIYMHVHVIKIYVLWFKLSVHVVLIWNVWLIFIFGNACISMPMQVLIVYY